MSVITLEQATQLSELGVSAPAEKAWCYNLATGGDMFVDSSSVDINYPHIEVRYFAYNAEELIALLGGGNIAINIYEKCRGLAESRYVNGARRLTISNNHTEALAELLMQSIKNKSMPPDELEALGVTGKQSNGNGKKSYFEEEQF